jgi:translocator protein
VAAMADAKSSRSLRMAAAAIALVVVASVLGEIVTIPNLKLWYAALAKPSFNPPNAVFGPVWTGLYALMAFAFWRILRLPARTPGRDAAIGAFLAQLMLNVLWPFLFFGGRSPALGLVEIVLQWLLVVATILLFRPLDRLAAACLVPLALWVAFAALLNFEIWRLN